MTRADDFVIKRVNQMQITIDAVTASLDHEFKHIPSIKTCQIVTKKIVFMLPRRPFMSFGLLYGIYRCMVCF